jgi:heme/copper-type cytochrome/quinol oxidase subunit 1
MKERVYEQISSELRQATRTETTVSIIGIVVTFVLFGMAFGFANGAVAREYDYLGDTSTTEFVVWATAAMFISLIAIVVINLYSIFAIINGKKRKVKLVESLAKLYQEEDVNQYDSDNITKGYEARSNLFIVILSTIASFGIIIPVIVFINEIVERL